MKDLLDTVDTILIFVLVLVLCFLFMGDPDVWDLLHAKAMAYLGKP